MKKSRIVASLFIAGLFSSAAVFAQGAPGGPNDGHGGEQHAPQGGNGQPGRGEQPGQGGGYQHQAQGGPGGNSYQGHGPQGGPSGNPYQGHGPQNQGHGPQGHPGGDEYQAHGQPDHGGPGGPDDHHDWRKGQRLSGDYRDRQYVVDDWHGYGLRQPPRGYQWVGVNGDYLLVAAASGLIAQIVVGH
jgi:Ni/Co efflux regulator RcnB